MSTAASRNGSAPPPVDILDQTADAIIALDRTGRIVLWNRAAERLFQRPASEVLGRPPGEAHVYPWLTPEDEQEALAAVAATGRWRGEAVRRAGDGRAVYLESTVSRLADADGTSVGLLAIIRDTTMARQKALEEEEAIERLRRMLERLKTIAGLVPICSHCKRIRDEHASWWELETYLGERLGIQFTHGICPTCFHALHRDCLTHPPTP